MGLKYGYDFNRLSINLSSDINRFLLRFDLKKPDKLQP